MIKFDTLAIKADMDELHIIFLLKKNVQQNIIKTILGYLPIAAPETLKEWKMAITSMEQEYESTERMIILQDKYRDDIQRARTAYEHWKVQQQFQGWKTKVFQLQQVQTYGKGILIKEERKRNKEMFQV